MKLILRDIHLPLASFTLKLSAELTAPVTAIFGPSGAGKTSLLDTIAGLRRAKSSYIMIGDVVLNDSETGLFVSPSRREIGYVPQDLALFPHLNVRDNILYSQRVADIQPAADFTQVVDTLEINALLDRNVDSLSGGEQQRVALARALLARPRLLLLDEPLASLDRPLKQRLLPYLRRIREDFCVPMLYVTHDLDEIATLCDEVIQFEQGQIIRRGTPDEFVS